MGSTACSKSTRADVTFEDLTITGGATDEHGGGMRIERATVAFDRVVIEGNRTNGNLGDNHDRRGGGVWINGIQANVAFTDTVIRNNEAYGHGGGVFNDDGTVSLHNVSFLNNANRARDRQGGGLWSGGRAMVTATGTLVFDGNLSHGNGGGFMNTEHSVFDASAATSVTIVNNRAGDDGQGTTRTDRDGGGFFNAEHGQVMLANATITNNGSATITRHGGGFYNTQDAEVTIAGGTIANNQARETGGGFRNNDRGLVTLDGVDITDNWAGNTGGGFRSDTAPARVNITDGVIQRNTASTDDGGGFYNTGQVQLTRVNVLDNTAGDEGAGSTSGAASRWCRAPT